MNKNKYTQREWDRVVGWGKVPDKYNIEKKDEEDEEEEQEEDEEEQEDDDDDEGGGEPMVQVGVVVRATHDECVGQWCCGQRNQGVEKCDQGTCCVVQWVECR